MNAEDYSERRRYPRISVELPVRMSTVDPEDDPGTGDPSFQASDAVCLNLSRGGALLRTEEPVASGKRLLLELEMGDGGQADLIGRVVWARRTQDSADAEGDMCLGIEWVQGGVEALTQHAQL